MIKRWGWVLAGWLWLSVWGMAVPHSAAAAEGEAKIRVMTGEAFIVGNNGIYRAKTGMTCQAGDMVMTRAGCQLDLIVNGQAGCRLLPDTAAAIASVNPDSTKLLVAEGNVILNVRPLPAGRAFTLETPTAVAAVRGTQFWGRVTGTDADTVTTLAVREGSVEVLAKDTGTSVLLAAGQAVDLGTGATASARPAAPAEMDAMKAADEITISAAAA